MAGRFRSFALQVYGALAIARAPAGAASWRSLPELQDIGISLALVIGAFAIFHLSPRRLRWLGMGLSAAASLRYIVWRATATLNFENGVNGTACVLLFLAELYTVGLLFLGHFQTFAPRNRITPWVPPDARWPSVDVFITTYDEGVDVVRRTAVGCKELRYAGEKQVWILDDGRRPAMRELAEKLGVGYLTRPDNAHAKAGNLNAAIQHTEGELIAQFDADHVPVRSFLERTVPFFFGHEDLAFVQTPHNFYNPDVFQRNLLVEDAVAGERDLFFHVLQPGNDRWNAAFFCGSNAVLSREALADVGGFATETITEDAHTALRLHAKGWKSAYLDVPLAGGLAAETYADALTQRLRWGMGMAGILKVDNPITVKGLSLPQRLCYFAASFFFFFGIPRLLFFLAPVGFMLLNIKPIDASILTVVTMFLPHILAGWFVVSGVSRNIRHTFWSEVYECAVAWHMAVSVVWTLFTRKKLPFKVTPKDVRRDRVSWNARAAVPQMVLLALTLVSLGVGVQLFQRGWEAGGVTVMNLVWLAYNALLLTAAVAVSIDRPQRRSAPRLPVHLPATLRWSIRGKHLEVDGVAVDLSEGGARVLLRDAVPPDVEVELLLGQGAERLSLPAELVSCRPGEDGLVHGAGLRFPELPEATRIQIIQWMYCDPETWSRGQEHAAPWKAFVKLAGSPFRAVRTQEIELQRRAPRQDGRRHATLRVGEDESRTAWVEDLSLGGARVVLDKGRLKRGQTLSLLLPLRSGQSLDLQVEVMAPRGARSWGLRFRELAEAERADLLWDLFVAPLSDRQQARVLEAVPAAPPFGADRGRAARPAG